MLWNVENLFLYLDNYKNENFESMTEDHWQSLSTASPPNKPLKKVLGLKRCIEDIQPDIIMLNEVGGLESLENFNLYFLNSQYLVKLIEGNSDRGIDVGYLVKKELPLNTKIHSNKLEPIDLRFGHANEPQSYFMSRDISELHFTNGTNSTQLVLLLTHLKSKLDPENIDKEGVVRRTAEAKLLTNIYLKRQQEHPNIPVLVCGDFNGILSDPGHSEFQSLRDKTDLVDSMNYSEKDAPLDRVTQIQFRFQKRFHYQFDYILIHPRFSEKIQSKETYIYYLKDDQGQNLRLPNTLEERFRLPSDHYPVLLTLNCDS